MRRYLIICRAFKGKDWRRPGVVGSLLFMYIYRRVDCVLNRTSQIHLLVSPYHGCPHVHSSSNLSLKRWSCEAKLVNSGSLSWAQPFVATGS